MAEFIPLSVPNFSGNERQYVNDAVVSEWVSTGGGLVGAFEEKFAAYMGAQGAVACASGTAGLHLAMLVAGVRPGDEVLAPALTFIAAINPIRYAGAEPVFIGCDDSLCIDAAAVEHFCATRCEMKDGTLHNKATGRPVRAVEVMHTFGNLSDMDRICATARRWGLVVIEDATEAVGSRWLAGAFAGQMAGTAGDVGVYSFNGNKILTTGSGGALVSRHPAWARRAKHLSTQAKASVDDYVHDEVGYNYRMTNLQAALGLAQLEQLEGFVARKAQLYELYHRALHGKAGLKILPFREDTRPNRWFFSLYLTDAYPLGRNALIQRLKADGIQARAIWGLINEQQPYLQNEAHALEKAEDYRARVVNIPCSTGLADADAHRVCAAILGYAEA